MTNYVASGDPRTASCSRVPHLHLHTLDLTLHSRMVLTVQPRDAPTITRIAGDAGVQQSGVLSLGRDCLVRCAGDSEM